ncbi:MAG TPA: hypothetical protein PLP04_18350, partial [Bryobacteraceae bacterium]|nr:hypothetical protein [Bryobacteraceae bacterium]
PPSAAVSVPTLNPQDMPPPVERERSSDYQGPAILSRGGAASVSREDLTTLRPYISINGIYDTDLTTFSLDSSGQIPSDDGYGTEALVGLTGSHSWSKTWLDLDYRGSFRHYTQRTYYDGIDNSLDVTVRHQKSRKLIFELGQSAARYSRSFFLPAGFGMTYNPLSASLTQNDLFDTPTTVLMSVGRAIYQKSVRLAFGGQGTGFLVRRRSEALAGATGFGAAGDITYRLSRFQTIGVDYSFNRFDYTGMFGSSDIHGIAFNYAARLSKRWEMALRLGGYRIETSRLTRVTLDPVLAAIFGRQTGIDIFHGVGYSPLAEIRFTRGFRRGSWTVAYGRSVAPGNGVYLTSNYDNARTGFTYNGWRRVSIHGEAAYSSYSSLSQSLGKYENYTAGGGASVKLSKSFSLVTRVAGRRYNISESYRREAFRATVGLAWSPGDYPLSIW